MNRLARLRAVVSAAMHGRDSAAAGLAGTTGTSLMQLNELTRLVKAELGQVTCPALILHATEDDVASTRNATYVAERLGGPVTLTWLDDCYHMITVDRQRHDVANHTIDFFRATVAAPPP